MILPNRQSKIRTLLLSIVALIVVFLVVWKLSRLSVEQQAATLPPTTGGTFTEFPTIQTPEYIEVTGSCGPYFGDAPCLNIRSGPGTEYPKVMQIRNGAVLRVSGSVKAEGQLWYKILLDEWIRYPERVSGDWYVSADFVRLFKDSGPEELSASTTVVTSKRIVVDLSEEMLYAYDGSTLFIKEPVSTGLEFTPTPRGNFTVFKKTPSRYMQGPLPGISDQYYDLPGVPWNLYFTQQGAVIHGAYWHDKFGEFWSHGCVNLSPGNAQKLYHWAELGTPVTVQD